MSAPTPRERTEIDAIAERWLDTVVELRPELGTYIGRDTYPDRYADYSPQGHQELATKARQVKDELARATPRDDVDRVTVWDLQASLDEIVDCYDAGLHLRDLNVIASPLQDIRMVYDLMPSQGEGDWTNIAARLKALPQAIAQYQQSLRTGIENGTVPARRQADTVAIQAARYGKPDGFFADLVSDERLASSNLPGTLIQELRRNAQAAADAYRDIADFLRTELSPRAGETDGIGRDNYALLSRSFLGAEIDLDETYEWGREELARMVEEQEAIARQIVDGGGVRAAIEFLEADQTRKLHGTEALRRWMQQVSDQAVADLADTHFEIPEQVRALECMIAPTQDGGIYYTGPSDDFSRPGQMWWSVPEGVTEFDTWRELTTVYHEGVPGHHLQIGQAVYNRRDLNAWRRLLAGTSGHSEGWALYAERLMADLGYLDDPADRIGMLDAQRMRAARVVLDLGVHLDKPNLDGTGKWTYEWALDFFRQHVNMDDEMIVFEVDRYFGWPGQAPSYKVGQRVWEEIRDETARRQGDEFDLKAFHTKALNLGGVRLDTLRAALNFAD